MSGTYIHSGGASYTDIYGITWMGDTDFSGGNTESTASTIGNTPDNGLYQTGRYGTFSYTISSLTNGPYKVILKFAEIFFSSAGQRQFNVSINGVQVLTNFDIIGEAGAGLWAIDKIYAINVTGGSVTVSFSVGAHDQPKVSAIAVVPLNTPIDTAGVAASPRNVLSVTSCSANIGPSDGSTLIALVAGDSALSSNFTSLKDNNGNAFTQDTSWFSLGSSAWAYFRLANTNRVSKITLALSAATAAAFLVVEVIGIAFVDVIDSSGVSSSSTTWQTPSVATTQPNDIIFGSFWTHTNGESLSTSNPWALAWTQMTVSGGTGGACIGLLSQIVNSQGSYAPTGTTSGGSWVGSTISYTANNPAPVLALSEDGWLP